MSAVITTVRLIHNDSTLICLELVSLTCPQDNVNVPLGSMLCPLDYLMWTLLKQRLVIITHKPNWLRRWCRSLKFWRFKIFTSFIVCPMSLADSLRICLGRVWRWAFWAQFDISAIPQTTVWICPAFLQLKGVRLRRICSANVSIRVVLIVTLFRLWA